ncbi:coiled-coil domain-containing protein 112-like isoform X2 [Daktulosphaira vitifoliae]|uniref:coiled-coil domain-containing protein 112-like isoform X2 n=1 Tax=Daktulosphaira vitifoliae TaxID=58002 RepID=UPI0021A9F31F|nr:coiled-coil domain-containing protein 112-like isoform X2 [Daktulosphaira vitifoliae]
MVVLIYLLLYINPKMSWSDNHAMEAAHMQILKNHLKHNILPECRDLLKYKHELDAIRHSDLNQMASLIQDLRYKLAYLKKTASDINKVKNIGLEKFRKDVKMFESKLMKLKEGSAKQIRDENRKQFALFEEIQRVKTLAVQDPQIKPFEFIDKRKKEPMCKNRTPISKNTYATKEIAEFSDFCAKNGTTGGWSIKDHEMFLKIRSKHGTDTNFVQLIIQAMPHITEIAASDHEKWYAKYDELKNKKKEAIAKWKHEKVHVFSLNDMKDLEKSLETKMEVSANSNLGIVDKETHLLKVINNSTENTNLKVFTNNSKSFHQQKIQSKDHSSIKPLARHINKNEIFLSEPITIVTLHGQSENFTSTAKETFPNLHLNIYGAQNQDVKC